MPRPCLRGLFQGRLRNCNSWHCLKHGRFIRLRRALRHHQFIPSDWHSYTLPIHSNRRMTARQLGAFVRVLRQRALRTFPDAVACVIVHVEQSCPHGRPPIPHLHLVLHGRPGTFTQSGMERVKQLSDHTWRVTTDGWQFVDDLKGLLIYLYRGRVEDEDIPEEELPRVGDRYRQSYGVPRRPLTEEFLV